jgi:hypothetical protein
VRGGEGDNVETAVVSGPNAAFAEARRGSRRQAVDRALLRFEKDGNTWMVQVKAQDMWLDALRTPKIETRRPRARTRRSGSGKAVPGGAGLRFLDELYAQFLEARSARTGATNCAPFPTGSHMASRVATAIHP